MCSNESESINKTIRLLSKVDFSIISANLSLAQVAQFLELKNIINTQLLSHKTFKESATWAIF